MTSTSRSSRNPAKTRLNPNEHSYVATASFPDHRVLIPKRLNPSASIPSPTPWTQDDRSFEATKKTRKQRSLTETLRRLPWKNFEATTTRPRKQRPEGTVMNRLLPCQTAKTWRPAAKSSEATSQRHSSATPAGTPKHLTWPLPRQTSRNLCVQILARKRRSLSEGNPELPEMPPNNSVQARPRKHRPERSFATTLRTRERRSLQATKLHRSAQSSATKATILLCTTPEQT